MKKKEHHKIVVENFAFFLLLNKKSSDINVEQKNSGKCFLSLYKFFQLLNKSQQSLIHRDTRHFRKAISKSAENSQDSFSVKNSISQEI